MHGYSFWIGLLIPFGIIYIMNWIIFILIFASLLCRPNVRKETSNHGNLRKLKENFVIALGLSLLFGMGWAVGLLASSDLPGAVRYPAEWIFTLMTAFLGVYLFALYILRSSEARKLWIRWLLCQRKKHVVGVSSTNASKTGLGILPSSVRSWWKGLKANILRRPCPETSANGNTLESNPTSTSTNPYCSSSTAGKTTGMTSSYAEPSSVVDGTTARVTSPYSPPVEIELVHKVDIDGESINEETKTKLCSPSKVSEKLDYDTESAVETMSFYDKTSLKRFNSFSSMNDPSLSGAHGVCYTVESKQAEGSDTN